METGEYRIKKFMEEYEKLTKKYSVDFANFPQFVPSDTDRGTFKVVVQTIPVDLEELKIPAKDFIPQKK